MATEHPVRRARLDRHLTLEALAEASGVHRITVINIEQRRHVPSLDTLFKLAEALEMSPAELMERPA